MSQPECPWLCNLTGKCILCKAPHNLPNDAVKGNRWVCGDCLGSRDQRCRCGNLSYPTCTVHGAWEDPESAEAYRRLTEGERP